MMTGLCCVVLLFTQLCNNTFNSCCVDIKQKVLCACMFVFTDAGTINVPIQSQNFIYVCY